MFNGTVDFAAKIKGNGLTFPLVDFNPNEPGVDRIEMDAPNGDEIRSTVHLTSVATEDDGRALAEEVNTAALNRIAFFYGTAIENARRSGDQFSPVNPPPGVHATTANVNLYLGSAAQVTRAIPAPQLKTQLEQPSPPGERHFGLLRSARQSQSPVEEFMHFYHILLMLYYDRQADVDAFIVSEDPAVQQTQHPLKAAGVMETVYTRLRNELAHKRAGVNLDNTKTEMANRLGGLIGLTKRAIGLHP